MHSRKLHIQTIHETSLGGCPQVCGGHYGGLVLEYEVAAVGGGLEHREQFRLSPLVEGGKNVEGLDKHGDRDPDGGMSLNIGLGLGGLNWIVLGKDPDEQVGINGGHTLPPMLGR